MYEAHAYEEGRGPNCLGEFSTPSEAWAFLADLRKDEEQEMGYVDDGRECVSMIRTMLGEGEVLAPNPAPDVAHGVSVYEVRKGE